MAASASTSFSWVACRNLKLIPARSWEHMPWTAATDHKQVWVPMWLSQEPSWSTVAPAYQLLPAYLTCSLKIQMELNKTSIFWFAWTKLALVWEPQSAPTTDPKKNMCWGSASSSQRGPSRRVLQVLWIMHLSISISLAVCCWIAAHQPAPWAPLNKY